MDMISPIKHKLRHNSPLSDAAPKGLRSIKCAGVDLSEYCVVKWKDVTCGDCLKERA